MQSSPIMALRAAIVLAIMVVVPLAAMMNTSLIDKLGTAVFGRKGARQGAASPPTTGERVADNRAPTTASGQPTTDGRREAGPETPRGDANALKEPGPQLAASATQKMKEMKEGPGQPNSSPASEIPGQVKAPSATVTGVRAVAGNPTSPLWSDDAPGVKTVVPPEPEAGAARAAKADLNRPGEPQQALYYGPPAGDRSPAPLRTTAYSTPTPGADGHAAGDAKIVGAFNRLRGLGAVYYRLESWGDGGEFFRCYCQVQMGGPQMTRRFDATESTALAAVEKVVAQVESWRDRQ